MYTSVMKHFCYVGLACFALSLASCQWLHIDAISGSTLVWQSGSNNFYNQEAATTLSGPSIIKLDGEVEKPVTVKLSKMPLRSVTVREVVYDQAGDSLAFKGTFRYDGYALCDILSALKVDKASKEDFWPPVDLYVEVSNDKGQKAVFSWGELFYSGNMYSIVIAKRVTRVIPGKTGELWTLPEQMKLVVESDLISQRNIDTPTRITVKSLKGNYVVNRDPIVFSQFDGTLRLMGAPQDTLAVLTTPPSDLPVVAYPLAYYGHGMGYKGVRTYQGQFLRDVLMPYFKGNYEALRSGMLSISGVDGYRSSFALSEIINRNDQREVLLMFGLGKGEEEGRTSFSLYAGCDAFADRSIKGLEEIRLTYD